MIGERASRQPVSVPTVFLADQEDPTGIIDDRRGGCPRAVADVVYGPIIRNLVRLALLRE